MIARRFCALVLCLTTTMSSSMANAAPAKAKPPLAEDQAIEEAAKTRYNEGLKLFSKKRYEEARVAFLQASALKKRPTTTFMVAECYFFVDRWLDALKAFDAYIAEQGDPIPPRIKPLVDSHRGVAKSHLGRVRFDVPSGAEITLDGAPVTSVEQSSGEKSDNVSNGTIDVMPGPHAIVITHRGEKKTEQIEAQAGSTVNVKPLFIPKALVPTSDTRTRPTPGGTSSSSSSSSSPSSSSDSVSILAPPATTWPVYVSGAVGLGGLAAAAIFGGLAANSTHASEVARETLVRAGKKESVCGTAERADFSDTCITIEHNDSVAKGHKAIFQTSLIVGLSGTAIAIGWFLLAPKEGESKEKSPSSSPAKDSKDSRSTTRIVPWVALEAGGLSMEGRF